VSPYAEKNPFVVGPCVWLTHLTLPESGFMEDKSSNKSVCHLEVPVSSGVVLYPWKYIQFCFLGSGRELGRAGFRSLDMGLLYQMLPVLLLLEAACHPESISRMLKT